jgi:hypothetical protein
MYAAADNKYTSIYQCFEKYIFYLNEEQFFTWYYLLFIY